MNRIALLKLLNEDMAKTSPNPVNSVQFNPDLSLPLHHEKNNSHSIPHSERIMVPIHLLHVILLRVQAHVPRHQTPLPAALEATLGVYDAVAPLRRLHELGVLLLEDLEVALGLPVPDGVGGEDKVHLLKGALVGFGVEGPDDDDGGGVDGAEEVEGLFVEGGEDGGEEEDLVVLRQIQ